MRFIIASPDETVLETEVSLIQLPGQDGLFEVLDRHAPILSVLKKGRVRMIGTDGKEQSVEIEGGIFGMADQEARLLIL